jgi:Flp pilus assembly protein TadG
MIGEKGFVMLKRIFPNEAGSALVELALVTPVLLLIMIGAAELGRIAYAANEVQNAARAGAAYGTQSIQTAALTNNIQQAAVNDAANFATGGITATANTYCVCQSTNSSSGSVSSTSPILCTSSTATSSTYCATSTASHVQNTIMHYVQVSTTATVKTMFHYPGIPHSFVLNGFSEMRVNQ